MTLQHGYQAGGAPRNPVPPAGSESATQRPESIERVIATLIETPRHQLSDAEWKNAVFTPTPEVM